MCQVVLNFVVLTGKITDLKSKRFKNHQKFSGKNETLIDLLSVRSPGELLKSFLMIVYYKKIKRTCDIFHIKESR